MLLYSSAREKRAGQDLENDTEKRRKTTVNSEMSFDLEGWETRTPD